ncbi:MAG: response regulator [Bacteroidetes bacterium]|nr:response regulator [Bacteroidota bacterium]MBS1628842.1 response regulator [Bacteroidota bacterium]
MKVLIVDDEIDLCLLLKSFFTRKGYETTCAYTLAKALDTLYSAPPDMLFLDNNLADGLGWSMLPAILHSFPKLQIFLISAYNPPIPPIPEGAQVTIIEKPISFSELENRLHI